MAILRPDIYQHNNPNLAIVDGDNVYGGFRSSVSTVNDLYTLSGKTGTPTAKGQLKEFSTIIYVRGAEKYYVLKDINNVDNALGWEIFESTSGLDVNAVNIGGGEGLVYSSGNTGTTLQFRTIKGIGSTVVTTSGDTINIESSSGTTNVIGKNIGIGSGIYYGKVGTELQFKSILGSGNTTVSQSGSTIIVHSIDGLTKADNGIGLSGDTIILGGELKHDTIIRGLTNSFTINTDIINLQSINGINIIDTDGGDGINIESDGGLISIVGRDNLEIEKTRVDISYSGLTITDSRTSQSGIEYASNYHSGYTNRSLVDKEYVDDNLSILNVNNVVSGYTVSSGDEFIGVSGGSKIYLMTNPEIGKKLIITHVGGDAYTNPITIDGNNKNINDSTSAMINTKYGSITIIYNGVYWSVIGFTN